MCINAKLQKQTTLKKSYAVIFIFIVNQILLQHRNMQNAPGNILLVEDNMFDAELTIWMLKKNNIENSVVHASTANNAMDFLYGEGPYTGRNTNELPKVILLDLKIGKVSGISVLEQIKDDERLRNIPVLVVSGSDQNADIAKCMALGASGYLVKPIEFERFTKDVLIPILSK